MSNSYSGILDELRNGFKHGKTKTLHFRETQLENLLRMYEENEAVFVSALKEDLRKPRHEALVTEVRLLQHDIQETLRNLKNWAEPEHVQKTFITAFDSPIIYKEPYGVVLVIGAWNYPLQLCMLPVHGALAAGNCVVVKPSEVAPATAKALKKLLPRYVNEECLQVVCGGATETTELLENRFDYIFYTGSTTVGKIIGAAAMKHLTPVTLELGGKSPCYLDDSVNFDYAVRRIMWGKCLNSGQTCIAPDYLMCSKDVEKKFISVAKKVLDEWYGAYPMNSPDLTRIINDRHFSRLEKLLDSEKTAIGGQTDRSELYIAPTVLVDVKETDLVMQEEIFGPILPILTVDSPEEAIDYVNNRFSCPLSMYIFTTKPNVQELFKTRTASGNMCVNDTMLQFSLNELPFGGVGSSGMGAYHGKYSYDTFTHRKSCLIRNYNPVLEKLGSSRYPPYTEKKTKSVLRLISSSPSLNFGFLRYVVAFGLGVGSVYLAHFFARKSEGEEFL